MIILDTQVVSQIQRGSPRDLSRLGAKLNTLQDADVRITVITPFEQLADCLGQIKLNRQEPGSDLPHFEMLVRLVEYFAAWQGLILGFEDAAISVFRGFDARLVRRIKSMDSRIAAIALAHDATLLSSNLRDFQQVPGLRVEDWLGA